MDSKLNIGIIGLGGISETHTNAFLTYPRANLYAICDTAETWLDYQKKALNATKAYTDYKELLADPDVDAVSICLPTKMHAAITIEALKAGKHVLCEKPMATSAAEARAMKQAADETGKKLMISHNQRFEQNVQLIRKYAEDGFFGDIYLVRIGWRRTIGVMPTPFWQRANGEIYSRNWFNEKDNGGGVLRDLGSHLLDLTMYITDFPELESVNASCFRKFPPGGCPEGCAEYIYDAEDMAVAQLKFKSGMAIQLEVSFGSYIEDEVLFTEIYGDKGGASRRNGALKFICNNNGTGMIDHVKRYDFESKIPQIRFVDSVLDDTPVDVTPEQGVRVIEILDAIYDASRWY